MSGRRDCLGPCEQAGSGQQAWWGGWGGRGQDSALLISSSLRRKQGALRVVSPLSPLGASHLPPSIQVAPPLPPPACELPGGAAWILVTNTGPDPYRHREQAGGRGGDTIRKTSQVPKWIPAGGAQTQALAPSTGRRLGASRGPLRLWSGASRLSFPKDRVPGGWGGGCSRPTGEAGGVRAVSAVEGCSGPGEPGAKALVLAPASCLSPDRNLELPAAVGHSFTLLSCPRGWSWSLP